MPVSPELIETALVEPTPPLLVDEIDLDDGPPPLSAFKVGGAGLPTHKRV